MTSLLSDLDELALKCRGKNAKGYIKKAIACYKAAAFRSAIVSTWIAVSFDIIDKLKELSLAGDKEAEQQIEAFEKARRTGDITSSLKFERDILEICRDKLELISPMEFIDLNRLQEDRNRCAHPSMTADGEAFIPSAELTRAHIRSAIEHLLQYPPAQGKYALDFLVSEVSSEYFPTELEQAVIAFKNSPLNKARDSLIRNFTIVLIKKLINNTKDYKEEFRVLAALKAIDSIHREIYRATLQEKLSNIIRTLDPAKLDRITPLIKNIRDIWCLLDIDIKQKLQSYVENLPAHHFFNIDTFLSISELQNFAEKRLRRATREELDFPIFFNAPPQVADRIIDLYSDSKNFEQANDFSYIVIHYSDDYSKAQIQKLINICVNNDQIKQCFELGKVINSLRTNTNITNEEFNNLLLQVGLNKYIKIKDEEIES